MGKNESVDVSEGEVKRSISLRLVRHSESFNNQVYTNARYIYRGGTPEFDLEGWKTYVETHRKADPALSDKGIRQAEHLAKYLVPHLAIQASHPVRIITSPMKRAVETIRPTLEQLQKQPAHKNANSRCHIKCVAFYHESEGCHDKGKAEEGMNSSEISDLLKDAVADPSQDIDFVGFPNPERGWYLNATSSETRAESEIRAAKFFLWLCEYLDEELRTPMEDVFDAGVSLPGEENENEHDKCGERQRRRRMALLVGHGDFMSLVLKRIVSGFGHSVENEGIPHRSAFVHFNTGITELEYFGAGRFLLMSSNQTPHISPDDYSALRTGGSLKDGWSYLMPSTKVLLNAEVSVSFSDELDEHVREQSQALKSLYLSSHDASKFTSKKDLTVEEESHNPLDGSEQSNIHFIVQRGLQVVGCATLDSTSGLIYDVAIKPSAQKDVVEALIAKIKDHTKEIGRTGSLVMQPRSAASLKMFEELGFALSSENTMELDLHH